MNSPRNPARPPLNFKDVPTSWSKILTFPGFQFQRARNYWSATLLLVCITASSLCGQTYSTLYNFPVDSPTSPGYPDSTLVEVSAGVFYGTARLGGANQCGSLFSITSSGTFTSIHEFTGAEGCNPQGRLIQGVDGKLYGVASSSPFIEGNPSTLFESDLNGNVSVAAAFPRGTNALTDATSATSAPDGSIYTIIYNLEYAGQAEFKPSAAYAFRYLPLTNQMIQGSSVATGFFGTPLMSLETGGSSDNFRKHYSAFLRRGRLRVSLLSRIA